MNAKRCKKLRWFARVQESMMPAPKIHPVTGIPSTLLVYEHPRSYEGRDGKQHTFTNRTIQYNPRTSGKGFYKALKGKNANIRGSIPQVRVMCQARAAEMLSVRSGGVPLSTPGSQGGPAGAVETPGDGPACAENAS